MKEAELATTRPMPLDPPRVRAGHRRGEGAPRVLQQWRNPPFEEFRPRTAWALLNAFTAAMKERGGSQPQSYAAQTMRLHAMLDPERN